jgi:nicotinamide-nucleotide amidase
MHVKTARILAVGTELTTGTTRDTNSGELARELTLLGVRVEQTAALPDDLSTVRDAFAAALAAVDMVVSTGGLGPTPDDLTREAIAAACDLELFEEEATIDWMRRMFERRGLEMPEANRKQAWLVDGATALENAHGTAPGWWLERPDGRLVVALPGPPREMWPMWREQALPRLQAGRLGLERASRTLRLTGIGESALVALIGEDVLRAANPQVATYARADAVDVVVTAGADEARSANELVAETVVSLRERVGRYVFAEGDQTWADALAARLDGRSLSIVEIGTGGQVAAQLGSADFLVHAELERGNPDLERRAEASRTHHGSGVGLCVRAWEANGDTNVAIAAAAASGTRKVTRKAFLAGDEGRRRAALVACATLWSWLAEMG